MKSLLIATYSICLAASLMAVRAEDAKETAVKDAQASASSSTSTTVNGHTVTTEHKRPGLNTEQKAARKELIGKYDKDNNGKLDKEERKAIAAEDKAKMKKAGLQARTRKVVKKD